MSTVWDIKRTYTVIEKEGWVNADVKAGRHRQSKQNENSLPDIYQI